MLTINPKYITDEKGKKLSVILSVEEFESMVEQLEELEDINLFDQVKKSEETSLPINEDFELIESIGKGK